MNASISAATLKQALRGAEPPLVIDKERKNEIHTWNPHAYK